MINIKQIIVIAGAILLIVVLFLQPVKSLIKQEDVSAQATESSSTNLFSLESVSDIAKQGLCDTLVKNITTLEEELKNADEASKLDLYKKLAQQWLDVNKPMPAAYIYDEVAKRESSLENWLKAGDTYTESYQHLTDTVMAPVLTENAKVAYEKALEIDENNIDARTGLGTALVNGPAPMAGITMLLGVVEEQPEHLKA